MSRDAWIVLVVTVVIVLISIYLEKKRKEKFSIKDAWHNVTKLVDEGANLFMTGEKSVLDVGALANACGGGVFSDQDVCNDTMDAVKEEAGRIGLPQAVGCNVSDLVTWYAGYADEDQEGGLDVAQCFLGSAVAAPITCTRFGPSDPMGKAACGLVVNSALDLTCNKIATTKQKYTGEKGLVTKSQFKNMVADAMNVTCDNDEPLQITGKWSIEDDIQGLGGNNIEGGQAIASTDAFDKCIDDDTCKLVTCETDESGRIDKCWAKNIGATQPKDGWVTYIKD